jgi:hypothetical protein
MIEKEGFRKIDLTLAKTWYFSNVEQKFIVNLCPARISRSRVKIGDHRLCLAVRIENPYVNIEDDPSIIYSSIRNLPAVVNDDIPLCIEESRLKGIKTGATIQARVLLIPTQLNFDPTQHLAVAFKAGCKAVETLSYNLGNDYKPAS